MGAGNIARMGANVGIGQDAASNWWEAGGASGCLAAYQSKGAASLAASYVNLANPGTYNPALGVAPTWDVVNGWTGNASTMYLKTGIVPAVGYSMLVQFTNAAAAATEYPAGSYKLNAEFALAPYFFGAQVIFRNGSFVSVAPNMTSGNLAVAGQQGYRNGVSDGGAIGAWTGGVGLEIYILCVNVAGVASNISSASVQAMVIYDNTIDDVAAVAAAMAAL